MTYKFLFLHTRGRIFVFLKADDGGTTRGFDSEFDLSPESNEAPAENKERLEEGIQQYKSEETEEEPGGWKLKEHSLCTKGIDHFCLKIFVHIFARG